MSVSARTFSTNSKFLHVVLTILRFLVTNFWVAVARNSITSNGLLGAASVMLSSDGLATDERILLASRRDPCNVVRNYSTVCDWKGVIFDPERNRVRQLGLEGSLTPKMESPDTIDIKSNSLSGSIPSGMFTNRSTLKQFLLSLNNFTGSMPDSIGYGLELTELNPRRNWLLGNISIALTSLTNLCILDMSSNQPTGNLPRIPSSPGGRSLLKSIDLSNNHFHGMISDDGTLREFSGMVLLKFSQNAVTRRLTSWLSNFRNVSRVNLSHNRLEGGIPYEHFDLRETLGELRLQGNVLTGILPDRHVFILLCRLDLFCNFPRLFHSLDYFVGVRALPLLLDELTRFIPFYHSTDNLVLVFNPRKRPWYCCSAPFVREFRGAPGVLVLQSAREFRGAPGPVVPFPHGDTSNKSARFFKASTFGIVAVACFAVSCVLIWIYRVMKPQDLHIQELAAEIGVDLEVIRITFEDLLAATDSYSDENIIAKGSSGSVYRAVLPIFPFVIDVKKFDDDEKGIRRLDREATTMKLIRHRNLVRTCGATVYNSRTPVPGFNVLVLEHMQHGTLDHLLYDDPLQDFSWEMRVNVAVDVATGLGYLHEDVGNHIQVIHGDIKPTSIFLKSGFVASIGDFGLARLAENGEANEDFVEVDGCWDGTSGYCPPEIGQCYMSTAGDVYSFGVVVLEMLVRRRPTNFDVETTGFSFVPWIRASFPGNVSEIIDCLLLSELEANPESVILLFKVGLLCTVDIPWERPTIKEALAMIESIPSRTRREFEVTASPIQVLARDCPGLAGFVDMQEYWIEIYDPSEKHCNAWLPNLCAA